MKTLKSQESDQERKADKEPARLIGPRMGVLLVIAGLLCVELLLRAMGYPNQLATVTDPLRGWVALPNQDLVLEGVPVHINRYGFRDIEWSDPTMLAGGKRDANASTFRVAMLGDSVTFGLGVRHGELCSEVLERGLASAMPSRNVQVMNFSFPGYCFEQMAAQYEEVVHAWRPDVVILCLNDTTHRPFYRMEGGGLVRRAFIRTALYQKWLEWTDFNAVHPVVTGGAAEAQSELHKAVLGDPFGGRARAALQELQAGVRAIATMQAGHSGQLCLLALPRFDGFVEPGRRRMGQELRSWRGFDSDTVVDPYERFELSLRPQIAQAEAFGMALEDVWAPHAKREMRPVPELVEIHQDRSPFLFRDRQHWSAHGHQLAAQALLNSLIP